MRKATVKIKKGIMITLLLLPGILVCLPIVLLVTGSVMDPYEIRGYLLPVFTQSEGYIRWKLLPDYPTFQNYGRLLFQTPQFFVLFWNSVKLVVCILVGQLLAGVPAAWAFAVHGGYGKALPGRVLPGKTLQGRILSGRKLSGSSLLFTLYVVLMLLPFQVTMFSSYLVLDRLSLLNTHMAVILPAIFSTFPVFLAYGGFREVPPQLLDAARIDGAGEFTIFLRIGLPLGRSGILSALILGFLEYWNLMEQPLAFLEEKALWPLSLYLPEITWEQAGYAMCASLITLIPAAFVFALGQEYLEQGIVYSGLKE